LPHSKIFRLGRTPAPPFGVKQLPFELEGGLFGRQQDERWTIRACPQGGADFGKAAEGLAAAGGTEEEAHLHTGFFAQSCVRGKKLIGVGMDFPPCIFCFLLGGLTYHFLPSGKSHLIQPIKNELCH
jgi:hypothetical protein